MPFDEGLVFLARLSPLLSTDFVNGSVEIEAQMKVIINNSRVWDLLAQNTLVGACAVYTGSINRPFLLFG